jgi:hypothetical protein
MVVMAEPKRRKAGRPKRSELPRPKGVQALLAAYAHPLRVRILAAMNAPKRRTSPIRLAEDFGEDVSIVAYHFRELVALGLLKVVQENKRRGAIEKVHETTDIAIAWDEEWQRIPPVFKKHISALTARLGVEALGAAIDSGRFGARDDSVLAQDTMRVDEEAAVEALTVLSQATETLMSISARAEARLAENEEEGFLLSYMLAGFEGSLRPV